MTPEVKISISIYSLLLSEDTQNMQNTYLNKTKPAEFFVIKFEYRGPTPRSNKNVIQKYSKSATKIPDFKR